MTNSATILCLVSNVNRLTMTLVHAFKHVTNCHIPLSCSRLVIISVGFVGRSSKFGMGCV